MRLVPSIAASAFLVIGAACSSADVIRELTPADVDARDREYLELFTHRQTDAALARVVPASQTPEVRQALAKMTEILRGQHFDSTEVIGAELLEFASTKHVRLTYELHGGGGWYKAFVATIDSGGDWRVEGIQVTPLPQSLKSIDWFPLAGRPPLLYAWLIATIVCFLISAGSAVFIASRREMPKRWRWVLIAMLGLGSLSLNWSTGEYSIKPVMVKLLSAGYLKYEIYGPYHISFALPLGAAIALMRYRKWRDERSEPRSDAMAVGGLTRIETRP